MNKAGDRAQPFVSPAESAVECVAKILRMLANGGGLRIRQFVRKRQSGETKALTDGRSRISNSTAFRPGIHEDSEKSARDFWKIDKCIRNRAQAGSHELRGSRKRDQFRYVINQRSNRFLA